MIEKGAPKDLTRQRGGWSSIQSFEKHYNRLHQVVDWEAVLSQSVERLVGANTHTPKRPARPFVPTHLGDLLEETSVSAECSALTTPSSEPTEEGGEGGVEGSEHEALTLVRNHACRGSLVAVTTQNKVRRL